MKKLLSLLLAVLLVLTFGVFAMASGEDNSGDQGNGSADSSNVDADTELGDYSVAIDSCRLAKDYEGKPIVIVKYVFTNNADDEGASFWLAFEDNVYQNGVGLNECLFVADSANYSADNQTKEIKKGASIDVEVAYELNDAETDIEVEVEELISFNDKKITKTFSIK